MKTINGAFVVMAMLGAAACTNGGGEEPTSPPVPAAGPAGQPGADPGVKAPAPPPATETPRESELTEQFGVFVVEGGADGAPGTRAEPLGSISAAIVKAKTNNRRVYVCGGTFREALALQEGVSVIGGYVCGSSWQLGGKRTRLEAPTSPAVSARNISKSTRFDGFTVIAPDGTAAARSSIALIADDANGLTVASVSLKAGRGADGADGVTPAAAVHVGNPNGEEGIAQGRVADILPTAALARFLGLPYSRAGAAGGSATCSAGPQPGAGGRGQGSQVRRGYITNNFAGNLLEKPGIPREVLSGEAGAPGADGASGAAPTFSSDGFIPGDGAAGTDGGAGAGGSGGSEKFFDVAVAHDVYWWSQTGGGGGSGGCAGLAATPGQGGGASAAAIVARSPSMTLSDVALVASDGGRGGAGAFSSKPSAGGHWGGSSAFPVAEFGGAGGVAGVSGSGAGGPSISLAASGGAPKQERVTLLHGAGGAGVPELWRAVADVGQTINGTPAGEAADVVTF